MREHERVRESVTPIAATKPSWTSDSLQPVKMPLNTEPGGHAALQRKASGHMAADVASAMAQQRVREPLGNGLRLQAKLTVGHVGDEYEQEADRIAEQVMRMPEPTVQTKCACGGTCEKCRNELPPLQRMEVRRFRGDDAGGQEAPEIVHDVLRSSGQPLDAGAREFFEPRLGWDLGDVRVHSGERADEAARSVNAVAFTVGKDVVFARDRYAPASHDGRKLMAHELVHVLRQNNPGADFGDVREHSDEAAIHLGSGLNARAFTYGSDVFFNDGEYNTASRGGKHLLAHELTHVVQQTRAQRTMIQRVAIGSILNEFFSPFSRERLWVMGPSDDYTRIVRKWQHVIDALNMAKADLAANCAIWAATHRTDDAWTPTMSDPPKADPNAYDIWVDHPTGTEPGRASEALITYVASGFRTQTRELHTSSIGSFGIYITVSPIDCGTKRAMMNIWMYNSMDIDSFGKYANHPAFMLSGMKMQVMWWNWTEPFSWGPDAASDGRNPAKEPGPKARIGPDNGPGQRPQKGR